MLLGAGASRAALLQRDASGRRLPVMTDIVDIVGLGTVLQQTGIARGTDNFEKLYSRLVSDPPIEACAKRSSKPSTYTLRPWIGIVIAPYAGRGRLGLHAPAGPSHILQENDVRPPIFAFLDEGLFRSQYQFEQWRGESALPESVCVTPAMRFSTSSRHSGRRSRRAYLRHRTARPVGNSG